VIKSSIWNLLHGNWRNADSSSAPGYTVLLPVPADLPVFLRIALATCAGQNRDHRFETLVIPDGRSDAFDAIFQACDKQNTYGPMRLIHLNSTDRLAARWSRSPHINHWLQLINGLNACRSTHAILHDADAFLSDPNFLEKCFETCSSGNFAVTGISEVWDDWYRKNGFDHIIATWEATIDVKWARSFRPGQHRGQNSTIHGVAHEFDTMLLPQCLTPGNRIGRVHNDQFIHFNYVICTYRHFQENVRAGKSAFVDSSFRILLIRLLANAYRSTESENDLPSISELEQGLTAHPSRVTYHDKVSQENYRSFREKLQRLVESNYFDAAAKSRILNEVAKFDQAFFWKNAEIDSVPASILSH
jgi:hypothetical protein